MNSLVPEFPKEGSPPLYEQMGFDSEEDRAAFEAMLDAAYERQWKVSCLPRLKRLVERAQQELRFLESCWMNGQQSFPDSERARIQLYLEWLRAIP